MADRLTHVDESGAARMVDVSGKDVTVRTAAARGRVELSGEVVALLRGEGVPKGDALAVARIAGEAADVDSGPGHPGQPHVLELRHRHPKVFPPGRVVAGPLQGKAL